MRLIDADKYIEEMSEGTFLGEISIKGFNEMFPTIEAYTKDEVIAMLTDILLEIEKRKRVEYVDEDDFYDGKYACESIIRKRISELRGGSDAQNP